MNWNAKPNIEPENWQQLQNGEQYRQALRCAVQTWLDTQKPAVSRWLHLGALSADLALDLAPAQKLLLAEKTFLNRPALLAQNAPSFLCIEGESQQMPFMDESIDGAILLLSLNFSADPHAVLRETARVLKDDGYLILANLSAFSPLLLKSNLAEQTELSLSYQTFSPLRLQDWLKLLSFEIEQQQNLPTQKGLRQFFAPLNLFIARKTSLPLTLQQQKERGKIQQFLNPAEALSQPIHSTFEPHE